MPLYRKLLTPTLIFLFSFFWIIFFAIRGVDPHHDGIIFRTAFDVFNGKALYKDTHTHFLSLTAYIHAFFLSIFGVKLISLRIASVLFYSLSAVLIWLCTKKITGSKYSIFSPIAWILLAPYYEGTFFTWPSIYGAFLTLLVSFIFLIDNNRFLRKNFLFMGFFSGLALWTKQTFLLLLIFLILYCLFLFIVRKINGNKLWSSINFLLLGFIVACVIFFIPLVLSNSTYDFYLQTIRGGYTHGKIVSKSFSIIQLFEYLYKNPFFLIFPASIAFFLSDFLLTAKKTINKVNLTWLGLTFISLSSIVQSYPDFDSHHFYWAVTPVFPIVGLFIYKIIHLKKLKILSFISLFLIASLFTYQLIANLNHAIYKINNYNKSFSYRSFSNGILVTERDQEFYSDFQKIIDSYMKEHKTKKLLLLEIYSLYLTFSEGDYISRPFHSNVSDLLSGIYPSYWRDLDREIKEKNVFIVLRTDNLIKLDGYRELKRWEDKSIKIMIPN